MYNIYIHTYSTIYCFVYIWHLWVVTIGPSVFSLDEDEDKPQQDKFWADGETHRESEALEQEPSVKTPSLEMFTAQLNVEPSTTWLKFGVGSDWELWPPALEQDVESDGIHRVWGVWEA